MSLTIRHYIGPIPHDGLCCLVIDRVDRQPCPYPAAYYATVADSLNRRSTSGVCVDHAIALRNPRPTDSVRLVQLRTDDPVRGPVPAATSRNDYSPRDQQP